MIPTQIEQLQLKSNQFWSLREGRNRFGALTDPLGEGRRGRRCAGALRAALGQGGGVEGAQGSRVQERGQAPMRRREEEPPARGTAG